MAEPNLDLGLEYLGGITKPTAADVGLTPIVALDGVGDPNFAYVGGIERRVYYSQTINSFTGSTAKTQLPPKQDAPSVLDAITLPVGFFTVEAKRLRVRLVGEITTTVGAVNKIGLDIVGTSGTVELDLASTVAAVSAATVPFYYEFTIFPSNSGVSPVPRFLSELRVNGVLPVVRTATVSGIDHNVAQGLRITTQLATTANVMLLRRLEVFGIGI